MDILTIILYGILGLVLSRMAGGGFGAKLLEAKKDGGKMPISLKFLPELTLAIIYSLVLLSDNFSIWAFIACTSSVYFGWQTGHADGYQMGRGKNVIRDNFLSPVAIFIVRPFQNPVDRGSIFYDAVFMTLKGLMIISTAFILTMNPIILLSALSFPLGYHIGQNFLHRKFGIVGTEWGEYFTGFLIFSMLAFAVI